MSQPFYSKDIKTAQNTIKHNTSFQMLCKSYIWEAPASSYIGQAVWKMHSTAADSVFGVWASNISSRGEDINGRAGPLGQVLITLTLMHTAALIYVLNFQPLSLPVNPIDWWSMKIHLEPKGSLLSLTFSLLYFIL